MGPKPSRRKTVTPRGGIDSANCPTHTTEPTSNDDAATDRKSDAGARRAEEARGSPPG
jgi:hypothetical protein